MTDNFIEKQRETVPTSVRIKGWQSDTCGCHFALGHDGESVVGVLGICEDHGVIYAELGDKGLFRHVVARNREKNAAVEETRKAIGIDGDAAKEQFYASQNWRMVGDAVEIDVDAGKSALVSAALEKAGVSAVVKGRVRRD